MHVRKIAPFRRFCNTLFVAYYVIHSTSYTVSYRTYYNHAGSPAVDGITVVERSGIAARRAAGDQDGSTHHPVVPLPRAFGSLSLAFGSSAPFSALSTAAGRCAGAAEVVASTSPDHFVERTPWRTVRQVHAGQQPQHIRNQDGSASKFAHFRPRPLPNGCPRKHHKHPHGTTFATATFLMESSAHTYTR